MDFFTSFPWTFVAICVTVAVHIFTSHRSYVAFITTTNLKIEAAEKQAKEDKEALEAKLGDANRRISDLASGVVEFEKRMVAFREHVTQFYVQTNEIADLRGSVDKALERMQNSLERATETMSDVRDSVIALTAVNGTSTVPKTRRAPAAKPRV